MAIVRYIKCLLVLFFLVSCSSKNETETSIINKKTLTIAATNNGYIINIDSLDIVQLVNDTTCITQLIFTDNKKVKLDFYIIPPYLTSAYILDIKGLGKVLTFESYLVGASGLSASIINVSMILLDEPYFNKVLSYNSFYGGIDLLTFKNNKIHLNIYDYNGIDENGNIIYCLNTFKYTRNGFIREETLKKCCILTNNALINCDNCNCSILKEPFVCKK